MGGTDVGRTPMTRVDPPLVTAIVAAYNAEPFIEHSVRSALTQIGVETEVIVVDDGSSDGTAAAVEALDDPRVTLLRNPENRGPSHARNRALACARGSWIGVLDADDWWTTERATNLISAARTHRADMIADDMFTVEGPTSPSPARSHFEIFSGRTLEAPLELTPERFIRENTPGAAGLKLGATKPLIRRALIEKASLRYDEATWFGEDMHFYVDCLLAGARFVVLPEAYYYRRRHSGSITGNSDRLRTLRHSLESSSRLIRSLPLADAPEVHRALLERLLRTSVVVARFELARIRSSRGRGGWWELLRDLPIFVSSCVRLAVARLRHLSARER